MGALKFYAAKFAAGVLSLIAMADVGTNSMWFFHQPQIPKQLKK